MAVVDLDRASLPLVTIGIPSFQAESHVGPAIASALAQTYQNFEVLVIDDASSDRTFEIVSAIRDDRLRVARNETNLGAASTWNAVVAGARGEFLKLLHSDDLIAPEAIERQIAPLLADTTIVMAASARTIVSASGRLLGVRKAPWPAGKRAGRDAVREIVRRGQNLIGEPAATLIRTAAIREAGGYDAAARYAIDLDLWVRLLARGDLYYDPEPLASYRVHPGQWSARLAQEQAGDVERLFARLRADASLGITDADVSQGVRRARKQSFMRRVLYAGLSLTRFASRRS